MVAGNSDRPQPENQHCRFIGYRFINNIYSYLLLLLLLLFFHLYVVMLRVSCAAALRSDAQFDAHRGAAGAAPAVRASD